MKRITLIVLAGWSLLGAACNSTSAAPTPSGDHVPPSASDNKTH